MTSDAKRNDRIAREHASVFLRNLHAGEWEAVYLAKRRELESNPNWQPNDSKTRASKMTARWADHRAETEDLIELAVSMASEPVTSAYVAEFTRLEVSTVKKYLNRLKAAGRVTSAMPDQWPYYLLWSAGVDGQ